jgi:DNA invertase Pin-like site-specific DNA recombinase
MRLSRKFDMVMAWSVDRLGRPLQDFVSFLSELHALHIDLFLHQRSMIQERVRAGLRRAKDDGKNLCLTASTAYLVLEAL